MNLREPIHSHKELFERYDFPNDRITIIGKMPPGSKEVCKNIGIIPGYWHNEMAGSEYMDFFSKEGFEVYTLGMDGFGQKVRWKSYSAYLAQVKKFIGWLDDKCVIIAHSKGAHLLRRAIQTDADIAEKISHAVYLAPVGTHGVLIPTMRVGAYTPWQMTKSLLTMNHFHLVNTPEKVHKLLFACTSLEEVKNIPINPCSFRAFLEILTPDSWHTKERRAQKIPSLVVAAKNDILISEKSIRKTAQELEASFCLMPNIGHDELLCGVGHLDTAAYILNWIQSHSAVFQTAI